MAGSRRPRRTRFASSMSGSQKLSDSGNGGGSSSLRVGTPQPEGFRGFLARLLASTGFCYFACGVVLLDSLLIGMEQNVRLERADTSLFRSLETAFVAFYLLELLCVLYAKGLEALANSWLRLDCLLVLAGVTSQFVLHTGTGGGVLGEFALVLRMVRMLRLARTYRVLVRFRELWLLAHGFVNSMRIIMHTLVLGVVILYVYGCVAMELIPLSLLESGEEELNEELLSSLEDNFSSLPVTMLTLLQFVTLDNPSSVYRPWLRRAPTLAWFFVSALLVMGVVFMNLVTAVIVNRALESAMQDQDMQRATQERKRKALLRSLEDAFEEADANCSGELSREELEAISMDRGALLHNLLGNGDLLKLFDYLDVDGDGSIGIDEFCVGIEGLVHSDTRLEIKRMERMLESMRKQLRDFVREAHEGLLPTVPLEAREGKHIYESLKRLTPKLSLRFARDWTQADPMRDLCSRPEQLLYAFPAP